MSNTAKIIADERDLIAAECQRLRNEYDKRCTELERRNRVLTAEVDRWLTENRKHQKECEQLRAEVDRLASERSTFVSLALHEAIIERCRQWRKVADKLASSFDGSEQLKDALAAYERLCKEGK